METDQEERLEHLEAINWVLRMRTVPQAVSFIQGVLTTADQDTYRRVFDAFVAGSDPHDDQKSELSGVHFNVAEHAQEPIEDPVMHQVGFGSDSDTDSEPEERKANAPAVAAAHNEAAQLPRRFGDMKYDFNDPYDIRIYKLIELFETLHDFDANYKMKKDVYESLETRMPRAPLMEVKKADGTVKRRRMKWFDMANSKRFIDYMTTHKKLVFSDGHPVLNPLFSRNIERGAFTFNGSDDILKEYEAYLDTQNSCTDCVNADIWCFQDADKKLINLEMVSQLCGKVRNTFGPSAQYLLDKDNHILRFVLCLKIVHSAFVESFAIELRDGTRLNDALSVEVTIDDFVRSLDVDWTACACDASCIDAEDHVRKYDDDSGQFFRGQPTGHVFRKGSLTRLCLDGGFIINDPDLGDKQCYAYEIDTALTPLSIGSSINHARVTVVNDELQNGTSALYSKQRMQQDLINRQASRLSIYPSMAMKRAGDWGMIEHCRRYGLVFVTEDKFAAYYAVYRDTKVMFLNVKRAAQNADGNTFVQYSFSLVHSSRNIASLF